jgi:transposase
MDLATSYRALVKKHFPQARILADRFHVIRTVNHHCLTCWKEFDAIGGKNRGLLCLMRRHWHRLTALQQERHSLYLRDRPALEAIYGSKQRLCCVLVEKGCNQKRWGKLARRSLRDVASLRSCVRARTTGSARPYTLCVARGDCLYMALHPQQRHHRRLSHQMELLQRQAFGFRNFQNYRLRVKLLCS